MTGWNVNAYAYEPLGMTRSIVASGVETVHVYTADDERAWTFQPGAPSRWTLRDLDGKVLRELKNDAGTWSAERAYVHRDGALLAAITPTETVHFHPDHLGTPRLITGTGGAYRSYHLYHPYGAEATAFNQDAERLKFTAHERDLGNLASAADDIDYMHARFYQPQVGRFLAVDIFRAIEYEGSDAERFQNYLRQPQTWNRYSYVKGNPVQYVDLDGYEPVAAYMSTLVISETTAGAAAGGSSVALGAGASSLAVAGSFSAGWLVGSALNEVPGVSDWIQSAFDSTIFMSKNRDNANTVNGLIQAAIRDLSKMNSAGGPEKDPARKHHKTEIKAYLTRAKRVANRLPPKLREQALKQIEMIAKKAGVQVG